MHFCGIIIPHSNFRQCPEYCYWCSSLLVFFFIGVLLYWYSMSISTFGSRLTNFYTSLHLEAQLPSGVEVLNPYRNPPTIACVEEFCTLFYHDAETHNAETHNAETHNAETQGKERVSIWGINPGRFGGGVTGLSFTDPVILRNVCGIATELGSHRELSAEYVWKVIQEYSGNGKQGAERFFGRFFLTAVCPLGFVKRTEKGVVNYNFYDDIALFQAVKPFIEQTMQKQCALGVRRDVAICFGTGKLYAAFEKINIEHHFFDRILPLEHPRFIMQYRRKQLHDYIRKYIETLRSVE
jgi:hypothetical protein